MSGNNSKATSRDEARQAALQVKQAQERTARRQRNILVGSVAAGLAVLIGVVAFIFTNAPDTSNRIEPMDFSTSSDPLAEVTAPTVATADGAIVFGKDGVITDGQLPDGVPVVTVYVDYLCSFCGQFEHINGPDLQDLARTGDAALEMRPVAILDGNSAGTQYSTRAAAAFVTVADTSPDAALAFNELLFAHQPAHGGLSDADMADLAAQAGADEAVVTALRDGSYVRGTDSFRGWVAAATEQAARDLPRLATPTVLIDGVEITEGLGVDWTVPGALAQAVLQASQMGS